MPDRPLQSDCQTVRLVSRGTCLHCGFASDLAGPRPEEYLSLDREHPDSTPGVVVAYCGLLSILDHVIDCPRRTSRMNTRTRSRCTVFSSAWSDVRSILHAGPGFAKGNRHGEGGIESASGWSRWSRRSSPNATRWTCSASTNFPPDPNYPCPFAGPVPLRAWPGSHPPRLSCEPISHHPTTPYGSIDAPERVSVTGCDWTYEFKRLLGTSLDSCGRSLGFCNCWVRDGREIYGRSCADALHS